MRDVTGGDFIGWMDRQLEGAAGEDGAPPGLDRSRRLRQALLEPLGQVHGVSSKVLSMALSDLLLGADAGRPLWIETGAGMIAIDSLVHNWLARTGMLQRLGAAHSYGPGCYGVNGCATIIEAGAAGIDARQFNPSYPARFPRMVQHAIWRFCAADELDICNGNRIDDRDRCQAADCVLFTDCGRQVLKGMHGSPR